MTNQYTFVFLTNDQAQLGRIKDIVKTLEGSVVEEKKMGTKTLAYPINKIDSADFYEWVLTMPATKMNEFKQKLGYEDALIRYLLLNKEE